MLRQWCTTPLPRATGHNVDFLGRGGERRSSRHKVPGRKIFLSFREHSPEETAATVGWASEEEEGSVVGLESGKGSWSSRQRKEEVLEEGPSLDPSLWLGNHDKSRNWGGQQGLDFIRFVFCLVWDSARKWLPSCVCLFPSGLPYLAQDPQDLSVLPPMAGFPSSPWRNDIPIMYMPHFLDPSSTDRYLGCFQNSAAVNNAARNVGLQIALRHSAFISFFIFWELSILFSIVAAPGFGVVLYI